MSESCTFKPITNIDKSTIEKKKNISPLKHMENLLTRELNQTLKLNLKEDNFIEIQADEFIKIKIPKNINLNKYAINDAMKC